jgi:ABC-type lipoprotein release transport system permease subunit
MALIPLVIAVLSAAWPTWQTMRIEPLEALR